MTEDNTSALQEKITEMERDFNSVQAEYQLVSQSREERISSLEAENTALKVKLEALESASSDKNTIDPDDYLKLSNKCDELITKCNNQSESIQQLTCKLTKYESRQSEMQSAWVTYRKEVLSLVGNMRKDQRICRQKYDAMRRCYEDLLHMRDVKSHDMSQAAINLPDEQSGDLALYALNLREQVIDLSAARDHLNERLKSETMSLRVHINNLQEENGKLQQMVDAKVPHYAENEAIFKSLQTALEQEQKHKAQLEMSMVMKEEECRQLRNQLTQKADVAGTPDEDDIVTDEVSSSNN